MRRGVFKTFLRRGRAREAGGRPLAGDAEGLERLGAERAVQAVGVLDVPINLGRRRAACGGATCEIDDMFSAYVRIFDMFEVHVGDVPPPGQAGGGGGVPRHEIFFFFF